MALVTSLERDMVSMRQAIARLSSIKLGPTSSPTFGSGTITNNLSVGGNLSVTGTLTFSDLTASRLIATNASKELVSSDLNNWVAATADETTVTDDGDGTITIGIADPLIVSKGGSGAATFTDHSLLVGSGTAAFTAIGAATNGQLPIGSTGNDPVLAALTGTENQVTVTNGAGSITLSLPQNIHTGASPTFTGLTLSGITQGSVIFAGASGVLSQDNSNLFWDNTNKHLGIGVNSGLNAGITMSGGGDVSKIRIFDTDNNAGAPELIFNKTRGAVVQDGDYIGNFFARGYDGSAYQSAAGIYFRINGTPGSGDMPGSIIFLTTPDDSITPVERLTIDAAGLSTFTGSIISANYEATNKLTACATNAGALDFSAASKTLTIEDNTVVSQDYSSDADVTFNDLTLSTPSNIYALSHDSFADFVADEHIAHSGVTLTAGKGLSGGGTIAASRSFALDLTEMTGNIVWDDGSTDASITWTYALSGATDPVWTIGNNSMDLTTGALKQGGTQVMLVGDAPTAHTHDGDTLQHDGINSDGGAFSFTTSGTVTFSQSIASANFEATNKLTACATNAGALDFSAASKTLTVEDNATVSQDYSSDASPTFAGLDLTGITDGYVPYVSAAGFANGVIYTDGSDVSIGTTCLFRRFNVCNTSASDLQIVTYSDTVGETARLSFRVEADDSDTRQKAGIWLERTATFGRGKLHFLNDIAGDNNNVALTDSRMVISDDGKVGIATTSPDTQLQVVGDCKFGDDNTNYISISSTGDQTFTGSAGFYPRVLDQAAEPAAGTGATQCDTGELVIWTDTDDSKCYACYNHGGTVKTVELS